MNEAIVLSSPTRRRCLAWLLAAASPGVSAQDALRYGSVPPQGLGGEIELIDHHGAPFTLSRLAGAPVLLFFGFTHCSSTCPVAMGVAREVLHGLASPAQAQVVFVTLDPLNDGPEQLRAYV